MPSPGHTAFFPPPSRSQPRLEYDPRGPREVRGSLQVPGDRRPGGRPRSLPPPAGWRGGEDERSRDYYYYQREEEERRRRHRPRSPISRAREAIENTFTDSNTGLGVGVLGALVGGLAAHEAAEATASSSRHHHNGGGYDPDREAQRRRQNQLLSTVVGATIGALGANAVEKRLEVNRERDRIKQERWEQKWGRPPTHYVERSRGAPGGGGGGGGGAPDRLPRGRSILPRNEFPNDAPVPMGGAAAEYYMSGGNGDEVVEEKREVVRRPRSLGGVRGLVVGSDGGGSGRSGSRRGRGSRGRGLERELDPEARSWRNVADWVCDGHGPEHSGDREPYPGMRSEDGYRY